MSRPILLRYRKQSTTVLAGSKIGTSMPSIRCRFTPSLSARLLKRTKRIGGYSTLGFQPVRSMAIHTADGICSVSRSEEHTSELQSLMRISYAVFCLKKKTNTKITVNTLQQMLH